MEQSPLPARLGSSVTGTALLRTGAQAWRCQLWLLTSWSSTALWGKAASVDGEGLHKTLQGSQITSQVDVSLQGTQILSIQLVGVHKPKPFCNHSDRTKTSAAQQAPTPPPPLKVMTELGHPNFDCSWCQGLSKDIFSKNSPGKMRMSQSLGTFVGASKPGTGTHARQDGGLPAWSWPPPDLGQGQQEATVPVPAA